MATIKCKIMRKRQCPGAAGEKVYPKTVAYHTLADSEFTNLVSTNRNLNEGQVKAVLTSAAEVLTSFLAVGHSVHIGGLGTFSLSMKGDLTPDRNGVLQLKNASVKTVNFRPSIKMQEELGKVKFELTSHEVNDAQQLNDVAALNIAMRLCETKGMFSTNDFAESAGVSYKYARKVLTKLIESGALKVNDFGRLLVYTMASAE